MLAALAGVERAISAAIAAALFSCTRFHRAMSIGMPLAWIRATVLAEYSLQRMTSCGVDGRVIAVAGELTAEELGRIADVFLAILQHCRLAVFAPAALADRLGDVRLVDRHPALDAVGGAGVRQALALPDARLVGVVRQQDVAGCQISRMQVVDVFGKPPAEGRKHVSSAHSE